MRDGPTDFQNIILKNKASIESWFADKWQAVTPILTSSVDLRNAGFKIAAVDTNVYPAGFNNLHEDFYPLGAKALFDTLSKKYPHCHNILLLPESHTRNVYYYENVAVLFSLLEKAGFNVRIGSLAVKHLSHIELHNGVTLHLYPLKKCNNKISIPEFVPDLILLNNDLSDGVPSLLQDLEQPVEPPLALGWFFRSKTKHFNYYAEVAKEFSQLFQIDPWQLYPLTLHCADVDFMERSGLDCIAHHAETLFLEIEKKYQEYNIQQKPFLMIKADTGTYGMGVMSIHDSKEIYHLNRKKRLDMSVSKGGQKVKQVLIQEGIPTCETRGNSGAAEPVTYLIGQQMIGAFYRVHPLRKIDENLNARGMHFEKLNFQACFENPQFYIYSVIARLALLATQKEAGLG